MWKHVFVFIIICLLGIGYFRSEVAEVNNIMESPIRYKPEFVTLKEGKFTLEGKPFYMMAVNFIVSLRIKDDKMWPSIFVGYVTQQAYHENNPDSCYNELKANFQLARDMGFNTLRVTSIGEAQIDDKTTGRMHFAGSSGDKHHYAFQLDNDEIYERYFKAIDNLLKAAEEAGLKVILVLKLLPESPGTEFHLQKMAERFKDNSTLIGYDFFNEPLFFDDKERNKNSVKRFTRRWHSIVRKNAPYQLCTVGLANQREVFEWDPNIVDVDFLSFHPYEYEPDQVRSELYWYSKHVKKPWIIGETGVTADNDSVPYSWQVEFARKTLIQNLNCGGIGYSWWQYKEVEWSHFVQDHIGLINRKGSTINSKGESVQGTVKPVVEEIKKFDPSQKKGDCICPPNYYNFSSNNQFRIIGKLVDRNGNGIEGGGILAWDQWWVNHYFTTSRPDGTFALYSNYPFYHWMASPTNFNMVRADIKPDTAQVVDGIPTINLGELEFHEL
jgi:hypothetical protein